MAKVYDHLTDDVQQFIREQQMFFVATAPLTAEGHVNISPKGMDCFRVLSPNRVAYLDMTGSGNETSAHMAENGRITFMFCAFKGEPEILRLYGKGETLLPNAAEWETLIFQFPTYPATRQIITARIHRVSTSCGYAVPFFDYKGERETLIKYWRAKGDDQAPVYQRKNNLASIDGLPAPLCDYLDES